MLYVIHVYCNASHYTHVDPKIWIILLQTLIPLVWESRCALYILLCLWIYIMILLMLQSIMYFFLFWKQFFFRFSDWQNCCFIFSTKKEKLRFFFIMLDIKFLSEIVFYFSECCDFFLFCQFCFNVGCFISIFGSLFNI